VAWWCCRTGLLGAPAAPCRLGVRVRLLPIYARASIGRGGTGHRSRASRRCTAIAPRGLAGPAACTSHPQATVWTMIPDYHTAGRLSRYQARGAPGVAEREGAAGCNPAAPNARTPGSARRERPRGPAMHIAGTEHDVVHRPLRTTGLAQFLALAPTGGVPAGPCRYPRPCGPRVRDRSAPHSREEEARGTRPRRGVRRQSTNPGERELRLRLRLRRLGHGAFELRVATGVVQWAHRRGVSGLVRRADSGHRF
jgi:hypothetical protein